MRADVQGQRRCQMNPYELDHESRLQATELYNARQRYDEKREVGSHPGLTEEELRLRAIERYKARQNSGEEEEREVEDRSIRHLLLGETRRPALTPAYAGQAPVAAEAPSVERAEFLKRTYLHLTGAVVAFFGLSLLLLRILGTYQLAEAMVSGINWLFVLGLFIAVSYVAERWAVSIVSRRTQYAGLALYVVAEAFLVLPLHYLATLLGGMEVIVMAALITLVLFSGLTVAVFLSAKNSSGMGGFLYFGAWAALALIVTAVLFGLTLGIFFAFVMIILACGFILYHTSRVLHDYREDQYVAASMALFASATFLYWYILWIILEVLFWVSIIFDF